MAGVTATYDLQVLNAMLEVESFFQEMLCDAYQVDNEDDLPGDIPEVDVVKFAELPEDAVRGIMERAIAPHPFKESRFTLEGVIGATLEKIAAAKAQTAKGKWPTPSSLSSEGKESKDDYDDLKGEAPLEHSGSFKSVHVTDGAADDHEAKSKPIVTAHYDLKTMNRIQQINNKFNDDLVELYGVEDEDDLPGPIMEITFGDVIVNDHWSTGQIESTLRKAIMENPWPSMDTSKLDSMLASCMKDLEPFAEKMSHDAKK